MCQQYFTIYSWCHCEEAAGEHYCTERNRDSCSSIDVKTVHMQCFCHLHATRGFKSERKCRKHERKQERKRLGSSSEKSSLEPRRKWYHFHFRSRTF
ncbi:uncharacterized protein BO97DRAFT_342210 [Aspergillus homomorphus CBS 101889]|uniref:Uncharacterized protein n=1 Tax=Aspergillus homomorphus (strain CBS 101889) TaxID=1450537 RepID=A0A395I0E0_ASPHC|nr:hypothetical protein BO97DRAFT_342210 [Aspergillus homomorphus CBS 101889]RAL13662.1 hypothetical protein BO97DRAFT_342210 [Aspergillus homomorphus CBS 101889]